MSSQYRRFLTPHPLLVVFLLGEIDNFWSPPPPLRRHSLWMTWPFNLQLMIFDKMGRSQFRFYFIIFNYLVNFIGAEVFFYSIWDWFDENVFLRKSQYIIIVLFSRQISCDRLFRHLVWTLQNDFPKNRGNGRRNVQRGFPQSWCWRGWGRRPGIQHLCHANLYILEKRTKGKVE